MTDMTFVIAGNPAYEMNEADPDWAPSLRLGHTSVQPTNVDRSSRRSRREQLRMEEDVGERQKEPSAPFRSSFRPSCACVWTCLHYTLHTYSMFPVRLRTECSMTWCHFYMLTCDEQLFDPTEKHSIIQCLTSLLSPSDAELQ